jgi:hypothetical protein
MAHGSSICIGASPPPEFQGVTSGLESLGVLADPRGKASQNTVEIDRGQSRGAETRGAMDYPSR